MAPWVVANVLRRFVLCAPMGVSFWFLAPRPPLPAPDLGAKRCGVEMCKYAGGKGETCKHASILGDMPVARLLGVVW